MSHRIFINLNCFSYNSSIMHHSYLLIVQTSAESDSSSIIPRPFHVSRIGSQWLQVKRRCPDIHILWNISQLLLWDLKVSPGQTLPWVWAYKAICSNHLSWHFQFSGGAAMGLGESNAKIVQGIILYRLWYFRGTNHFKIQVTTLWILSHLSSLDLAHLAVIPKGTFWIWIAAGGLWQNFYKWQNEMTQVEYSLRELQRHALSFCFYSW